MLKTYFSVVIALGFVTILTVTGCKSEEDFRIERANNARLHFEMAQFKELAQDTRLTLPECIRLAHENNLDAKVYKLEEAVAAAKGMPGIHYVRVWLNSGTIKTGDDIAKLGEFYAKAYFEKLGEKKAVLYGPAYKGISLAVSAAVALSKKNLNVPFFFNRKEVKDHGEGGVFVGYVPTAGEEVVIIEDVITAGTAIRESMEILSHLEGVKVAATFIMVDRKEKGQTEKGAMQEIEEQFGFPVYSIVDVYDIIEYLEEDPKNAENVERIKNYLAVNGAKA